MSPEWLVVSGAGKILAGVFPRSGEKRSALDRRQCCARTPEISDGLAAGGSHRFSDTSMHGPGVTDSVTVTESVTHAAPVRGCTVRRPFDLVRALVGTERRIPLSVGRGRPLQLFGNRLCRARAVGRQTPKNLGDWRGLGGAG